MSRLATSLLLAICSGIFVARGSHTLPLQQAPPREAGRPNPYQGQERARLAGKKLYLRECSGCHGAEAQGSARAPGLSSSALRQTPPGAIFWVLRNGSLRHGMPSFSHLPEQRRWQIVTYLKTLK